MVHKDMTIYRRSISTVAGWGRPEYTGWIDESMSWKQDCYIGDWSFLDELHVEGPDALKLFSDFAVNSFAKFDIGQAKHIICCSASGKVIGEGVLMRLGPSRFEFQALGPVTTWLEYNLQAGGYDAVATNKVSKFKFQISGPKSIFLLEELTGTSLRDIKFMHHRGIEIRGHEVVFLRQGMAGEIGFEIQGPNEHAREVMQGILKIGRKYGLRRLGSRTAMVNHLEACFPTVTHDYIPAVCDAAESDFVTYQRARERASTPSGRKWRLDGCLKVRGSFDADNISAWYRSPVELGWTRNIKFDHDFRGRAALDREVADPKRKIVTLVWNADDCIDVQSSLFREHEEPYDFMDMPRQQFFCMNAHKVMIEECLVGVATSLGFSYFFRKMLSHCTIDLAYAEPGTPVTVIWGDPGIRQKAIRATVAPSPFKKDNRRVDITAMPVGLATT